MLCKRCFLPPLWLTKAPTLFPMFYEFYDYLTNFMPLICLDEDACARSKSQVAQTIHCRLFWFVSKFKGCHQSYCSNAMRLSRSPTFAVILTVYHNVHTNKIGNSPMSCSRELCREVLVTVERLVRVIRIWLVFANFANFWVEAKCKLFQAHKKQRLHIFFRIQFFWKYEWLSFSKTVSPNKS